MGQLNTNAFRQPLIDAWNAIAGEGNSNATALVDSMLPQLAVYATAAAAGSVEDADNEADITAQIIANAGIYGIDVEAIGERTVFAYVTTALKVLTAATVLPIA